MPWFLATFKHFQPSFPPLTSSLDKKRICQSVKEALRVKKSSYLDLTMNSFYMQSLSYKAAEKCCEKKQEAHFFNDSENILLPSVINFYTLNTSCCVMRSEWCRKPFN